MADDDSDEAKAAGMEVTLRRAFQKYDRDGSGAIDAGELFLLAKDLGLPLAPEELAAAVDTLDADDSGEIDLDEFVAWWRNIHAAPGQGGGGGGGGGGEDDDDRIAAKLAALAAAGTKMNYVDVHMAAYGGDLGTVREFVAMDASLANAPDRTEFGGGYTPLLYAAYGGHRDVCLYLLRNGARIDARNDEGCSSLFLASQQGHGAVVECLLKRGARLNLADHAHGLSPLDVAATVDIRHALERHGDAKKPSAFQGTPKASCPKPGRVKAAWKYDPEGDAARSLPVSGFLVRVVDVDADAGATADAARAAAAILEGKDHAAPEAKEALADAEKAAAAQAAAGDGRVLREVAVRGDKRDATIRLPGFTGRSAVRVAMVNALGAGPFGPVSNAVSTASVPDQPARPRVGAAARGTLRVDWVGPHGNGGALTGFALQVRVATSGGAKVAARLKQASAANAAGADANYYKDRARATRKALASRGKGKGKGHPLVRGVGKGNKRKAKATKQSTKKASDDGGDDGAAQAAAERAAALADWGRWEAVGAAFGRDARRATLSGLAGGAYQVRVRARNAKGHGPWSSAAGPVTLVSAATGRLQDKASAVARVTGGGAGGRRARNARLKAGGVALGPAELAFDEGENGGANGANAGAGSPAEAARAAKAAELAREKAKQARLVELQRRRREKLERERAQETARKAQAELDAAAAEKAEAAERAERQRAARRAYHSVSPTKKGRGRLNSSYASIDSGSDDYDSDGSMGL